MLVAPGVEMQRAVTISLVLLTATSAMADPRLSGQVTDLKGKPLADAVVVVAGTNGEHRATTDADGRYTVDVGAAGSYAVLMVSGVGQMTGYVTVPAAGATLDGKVDATTEVIVVRDPKHVKRAKPVKDPRILPKYSDRAIEEDRWTRAWLLLDVDETGTVSRVKFLKRPGYDLDQIAIEHAFKTKFTPATANGVAQRSLVVWPIEWPSYWWMVAREGVVTRLPEYTYHVPCAGDAGVNLDSIHPALRDCSVPDLSKMDASEPWITNARSGARSR